MTDDERRELRMRLREDYRQADEALGYSLVRLRLWGEAFRELGDALLSQTPENTRFADGLNTRLGTGEHGVRLATVPTHAAIESALKTIQVQRRQLAGIAADLERLGEQLP